MSQLPHIEQERLNDFLLRLVAAQSESTREGEAAKVLGAELEALGFTVEVDDIGNVIGSYAAGSGPTVLFDSHLDTVGVTDPSLWSKAPTGEVVGDRIYGRGTVDMKGPLAACVHGVAAALPQLDRGRVVITGTVAEELAEGPALVHATDRLLPDYVVICEATSRRVALGQRGRAEVLVEVEGQSCHSAHPAAGRNAAEAMADVIVALRRLTVPHHPVLGEGILVLTDVMSRPYPGLSVVPDLCLATFDRRTLPGETEMDVLDPIQRVIDDVCAQHGTKGRASIAVDHYTAYTGTSVDAPNFAPAWIAGEDSPLVSTAVSSLERHGLDHDTGHYAFCTNGSGTAGARGIPTIGYGPGEEHVAHSVDESIAQADLYQGALGYAAMVAGLLTLPTR